MPSPRLPRALVLVLLLAGAGWLMLAPGDAIASARSWRWPLRGEVVQAFGYSARHPFAAGQRRGIDVAAPPGTRVGAACAGRVTFAGPVPSGGRGVSVRCGAFVATHLGLGRLAVRRGAVVAAGGRLGALGSAGRLRLGARRRADRFGYVDPAALLGDATPPAAAPPLGAAPQRPAPPRPVPTGRRVPAVPAVPRPRHAPVARPPAAIPAAAWGGLVLLAAGLPVGGVVRRDRRRRAGRALEALGDAR